MPCLSTKETAVKSLCYKLESREQNTNDRYRAIQRAHHASRYDFFFFLKALQSYTFFFAGESKPAWAGNKTPDDFVLLKPDGTRCPVTQFRECGLATVPTHAVVTRLEKQKQVQSALCQQQKLFGNNGSRKDEFQMFQSQFKDDLFKDGTLCLVVPKETTYEGFLGQDYLESIAGLKSCSPSGTNHTLR
uniref:Transferrin-like domain-containing protein n=1 Tax=Varanus komodoensis TaxID=61221 RepID=A0A8D2JIT4_VARKO